MQDLVSRHRPSRRRRFRAVVWLVTRLWVTFGVTRLWGNIWRLWGNIWVTRLCSSGRVSGYRDSAPAPLSPLDRVVVSTMSPPRSSPPRRPPPATSSWSQVAAVVVAGPSLPSLRSAAVARSRGCPPARSPAAGRRNLAAASPCHRCRVVQPPFVRVHQSSEPKPPSRHCRRPCVVATTVVVVAVGRCPRRRHRHRCIRRRHRRRRHRRQHSRSRVALPLWSFAWGRRLRRHLRPRSCYVRRYRSPVVIVWSSPSSAARRRRCRR